ncbi:MAG: lamin tail domain-containing protein, partial [Chloroflexota bacterium]
SSGLVYQDGGYQEAPLFENPFFATGFPVTAPYWARVAVGGSVQDVLLQCFERRCLTYTPENDPGWQVESGNVGQHYYTWRYDQLENQPEDIAFGTTGDVRVSSIMEDPPGVADGDGEYVDIQNVDDRPVDLTGWRLEDEVGNSYTFPDDVVIGIDATIRIHVCDGEDSETDLYWGRCSAVWNNDGDTAYLYDSFGDLVHSLSY